MEPTIHYPPLEPTVSQMNPTHILTLYIFKIQRNVLSSDPKSPKQAFLCRFSDIICVFASRLPSFYGPNNAVLFLVMQQTETILFTYNRIKKEVWLSYVFTKNAFYPNSGFLTQYSSRLEARAQLLWRMHRIAVPNSPRVSYLSSTKCRPFLPEERDSDCACPQPLQMVMNFPAF